MNEYDRLTKFTEDHWDAMQADRKAKRAKPNENMESGTADRLLSYDFWCLDCQEDFAAPCYKSKHRLWGDVIAVYRANCPDCGKDCLRHITHRDSDPYYEQSRKIRIMRAQYAWETLQANEYGFRTCYGNPWKKHEEELMAREERIMQADFQLGLKSKSRATSGKLKLLNER